MSVDKKWSELSTVTTLPDASFLALLDLTQSVDDQNQIISSLNAKTYFQQTLVTTIDAQSNNITDLGSISFGDVDTSITQSVNDLLYDVATGGSHVLRINDVVVYTFNADTADFGTSDIVNVGQLGVGTDTPLVTIHSLSTTEQLRLSYDDDNYVSFTVGNEFDLSTANYNSIFFFAGDQDVSLRGLAFSEDGTKMFMVGTFNARVYQYDLTTGFDLSTASYDDVFLIVGFQDSFPTGIAFNTDGTKMFIVGENNEDVFQYTLTTGFDLSTASYDEISLHVGDQDETPTDITFNTNGTKMFVTGDETSAVYQYTLTTVFDLSTATYDNVEFFVLSEDSSPRDIAFNTNGTKMFIVGNDNSSIYQYSLTTGFDISTASYSSVSFSAVNEDTNLVGIAFDTNGSKMFVTGDETDSVFQYSLGSVDITPTSNELIFNSNVTINGILNNPTITSFTNATHNHTDVTGGGQLDSTLALSDTENIVYLNTTNTYDPSVEQNFGTSDIVNVGQLGVGTDTPLGTIHSLSTTEQLRLSYDGDNYVSFTVDAGFDLSTTIYDDVEFSIINEESDTRSITFNEDGTKMFIVGTVEDSVFQYTLTTGFDISTASYDDVEFLVSQELLPRSMAFNTDGTKMFIVGDTNNTVFQYTLTTGFDVSTASYDGVAFSVSGQEPSPRGMAFNTDGTKMFIVGATNDEVFQYTLTTGFDISTATYDEVAFSVTDEDAVPSALIFNTDGTKMFIVGEENDSVYQYSLTTVFDVSTASYDSVSFSVTDQEATPTGIAFNTDGTKMFIVGNASKAVFQYSLDVPALNITPTNNQLIFNSNVTINGIPVGTDTPLATINSLSTTEQLRLSFDDDNYVSFTVGAGFDLSTANYNSKFFSVANEGPSPRGIAFDTNGTKMFIVGSDNNTVFQYSLTTVFDVSTASYDSVSFSVVQDGSPTGVAFNTDGTKMFISGNATNTIYQYTLTTGFDLSIAIYNDILLLVSGQDSSPTDLAFNINGTKMFIVGNFNGEIYQYTLTTGFDLSTATYDDVFFSVTDEDPGPRSIKFNEDGTKMFIVGNDNSSIYQYTLTTGFDLSTASYSSVSFSIVSEDDNLTGIAFDTNGSKMFVTGNENDAVFQYSLGNVDITPTNNQLIFNSNVTINGAGSVLHVDTNDVNTVSILNLENSAGNFEIFRTDATPESNVVGSIGDITIDSTNGHEYLKKTGDATNTGWMQISMNTTEVVEINTSADFTNQITTGTTIEVNADEDLTNRFHITPITSTEFTITGINSNLRLVDDGVDNFIVYTGTGTFITGVNGGICRVENIGLLAVAGGTLFDFTSTNRGNDIGSLFFSNCTLSGWNLGTISRDSTSEFGPIIDIDTSGFGNWNNSLIIDTAFFNVNKCIMEQSEGVTSNTSTFVIQNSAYKKGQASFRDIFGTLLAGETLVRIDAGIPDVQKVVLTGNLLDLDAADGLFDVSGDTGAFTAVVNNSISSTAINSVTDSSGVASFTHTGTSPALGSTVTISGFTTNTDYNTTGIVTSTTATTFEIDYVSFGTDETGSYVSLGVTITATAHGLTQGTGVTIDTTLSTDYDSGYLIYNIQTNSFDVAAVFTSNLAGTWSTEGLDQTDPRVLAFSNPGVQDSKVLAFGFINGNTETTTLVNEVYSAIDVSGFSEESITQRFKLINSTNGIFELTALEDFEGFLSGSLSATKSGNTENYRFTISTNSVIPTFATANYIPMEVAQLTKINIPLEFFVSLSRGDTIQIMVAGDGTSDSLIVSDMVISVQ